MSVAGWLFKIMEPGEEPGTRPIITWWAAWFPDEANARAAILKRTGPCEDSPVADRTLTEEQLKRMGLSEGSVRNVRTDF
jgi:hypothetical protein